MFKNRLFTALILMALLTSAAPTVAGGTPDGKGIVAPISPAAQIIAFLAVHARNLAPMGWDRLRAVVNQGWEEQRRAVAQEAIVNPTPAGFRRAKRMRDGQRVATFGALHAEELRNVLYIRTEHDLGLTLDDLIDVGENEDITNEEFLAALETLIVNHEMQRLVVLNQPRYVGIVMDAAETGRNLFDRMNEEERETDYNPDRAHSEWNRNFVVYHQPIAFNLPLGRAKELEGLAIRRLRAQLDAGMNSNGGKRSTKRALKSLKFDPLTENCGDLCNFKQDPNDDFDKGGASSEGVTF